MNWHVKFRSIIHRLKCIQYTIRTRKLQDGKKAFSIYVISCNALHDRKNIPRMFLLSCNFCYFSEWNPGSNPVKSYYKPKGDGGRGTGKKCHDNLRKRHDNLRQTSRPSSRPQPQHWIKFLDPWMQDFYPVLGWGLAPA